MFWLHHKSWYLMIKVIVYGDCFMHCICIAYNKSYRHSSDMYVLLWTLDFISLDNCKNLLFIVHTYLCEPFCILDNKILYVANNPGGGYVNKIFDTNLGHCDSYHVDGDYIYASRVRVHIVCTYTYINTYICMLVYVYIHIVQWIIFCFVK